MPPCRHGAHAWSTPVILEQLRFSDDVSTGHDVQPRSFCPNAAFSPSSILYSPFTASPSPRTASIHVARLLLSVVKPPTPSPAWKLCPHITEPPTNTDAGTILALALVTSEDRPDALTQSSAYVAYPSPHYLLPQEEGSSRLRPTPRAWELHRPGYHSPSRPTADCFHRCHPPSDLS